MDGEEENIKRHLSNKLSINRASIQSGGKVVRTLFVSWLVTFTCGGKDPNSLYGDMNRIGFNFLPRQ